MPRVTFSNDLNDFVRGFGIGSAVADSAEDAKLKKQSLAEEKDYKDRALAVTQKHYDDINNYYASKTGGAGGGDVFATPEGDANMQAGRERFGVSSPGKWWTPERMKYAANVLETKAGLSPMGASGLVARWAGIEAKNGPGSINPKSGAFGIGQWLGSRKRELGGAIGFDDQLLHAARELSTSESAAARVLRSAKTEEDAMRGASMFERAEGFNPKTGFDNFSRATPVSDVYRTVYGRPTAALPMNIQPTPQATAAVPTRGVDDAEDDFLQFGSCGGMVKRYGGGGAVTGDEDNNPNDADDQKPYYATDLMSDVGNALNKLPEVIGGALQGVQDMFGLNEQPAVAQADPNYMKKVEAFTRDEGAPPPEQVAQVRQKVDPNNELGEGLGTVYGMVKTYDYYLKQGDIPRARQAAGALVLYSRSMTRQLGALAVHALQSGDETEALKAIKHAVEMTPTGQTLKIDGNKGIIVDQKTGKTVREFEINEGTLMDAAMGFTTGKAYYNDLMSFAKGELDPKYEQAGVKADAQVTSASIRADATNNATQSRERIAAARNKVTMDKTQLMIDAHSEDTDKKLAAREKLAQMGIDATALENTKKYASAKEIRQMMIDANSEDTDKRLAAQEELANLGWDMKKFLKQMDIDADASLQDDKQEFQGDQGDKNRAVKRQAIETTANTAANAEQGRNNRAADRNRTLTDNQAIKLDTYKGRWDADRRSREGIAGDRISAQAEQGDKNRAVRQSEGAANRGASMDRVTKRVEAQAEQGDLNRGAAKDRVGMRIGAQAEQGELNRKSRESEGAANRGASMDRVNRRMEGAGNIVNRRVTARQHDAVEKMSDYEILGKDEATGDKISSGQAQATRTIAHGILDSNRGFGRQGVDYARQLTAWDNASRRPLTRVKLNEGKDGYSVTMPDGVTLQLDEPTFRQVQRIHGAAAR